MKLTWYDGGQRPPFLAERGIPDWGAEVLFIGKDGMLIADYGKYHTSAGSPVCRFQEAGPDDSGIDRTPC